MKERLWTVQSRFAPIVLIPLIVLSVTAAHLFLKSNQVEDRLVLVGNDLLSLREKNATLQTAITHLLAERTSGIVVEGQQRLSSESATSLAANERRFSPVAGVISSEVNVVVQRQVDSKKFEEASASISVPGSFQSSASNVPQSGSLAEMFVKARNQK